MNEMVTIPKDEYLALLKAREDLDDVRAIEEFLIDPKEGLPHEFMTRLIDGESPLAVFREWRGLSQSALSRMSGVNRIQIIDIEKNGKSGSVATLKKLATTLEVTLDDLA